LPLAQVLARPAQLEVALRDLEAVGALEDHLEPLARGVGKRLPVKQDADALAHSSANTSTELMQLREPEALGAFDHHERGVRHIDADLDHGGANQQLRPAGGEIGHHRGLFR
jgi:hypothetical protein